MFPHGLPTELWLHIIEQFVSYDDLLQLSATCRLFHDIGEPFLFRSLTFTGPSSSRDPIETVLARTVERIQRIEDKRSLAHYVRECTLDGWTASTEAMGNSKCGNRQDMLFRGLIRILPLMVNLRRLSCIAIPILPALHQVIHYGFPNLQSLALIRCDLNPASPCFAQFSFLQIEELNVHGNRGESQVIEDVVSSSRSTLRVLSSDSAHTSRILRCLQEANEPLLLERVEFAAHNVETATCISELLENCPSIKDLSLDGARALEAITLSPTSIPSLHSFRGPPKLSQLFVDNRPVTRVALVSKSLDITTDTMAAALAGLTRSTTSIRSMELRAMTIDGRVIEEVGKNFSELESLYIKYTLGPPEQELRRLLQQQQLSSLRSLKIIKSSNALGTSGSRKRGHERSRSA